jgi:hypothetical protein
MSGHRARAVLALGAAVLLAAACGKQESPPVQDPAAERAAATERAKQGPFGADLNKKAEDNLEKADK